VRCGECDFIYIAEFQNKNSLIVEGPVLSRLDTRIPTNTNLNDHLKSHWKLSQMPAEFVEIPAERHNSLEALQRVGKYHSNGRILDFGCGWGFFLSIAKEKGWECHGLEPLAGHSLYARAKFGLEVVTDTLRDDTFPKNYFDVITAFQVFEHLPDPALTLKQLQTFQKSDGLILIEVPNIDTWGVRLLGGRYRHFNPDHINFFSKRTLRSFLESNHYEVLELYYPNRYLTLNRFINYWLRRTLPSSVVNPLSKFIRHHGWLERIIKINLGDILGVVARKPDMSLT